MPRTKFTILALTILAFAPATANASDIIKNPASVVMTQLNIAKKKVMGHFTGDKAHQKIMLDGARVKAPGYEEDTEKNTKIWFTTDTGEQLKWPFIELYHSNPAAIEPAAGIPMPLYTPSPKTYNHYSGRTHKAFASGLPSAFKDNKEMPYYAALKTAPAKRPEPRKTSLIK